jgi:lipid II isoglutaminyl synthase (glutamine-hydrolysing)
VLLARLGSSVSRMAGYGDGTAIGGRLALSMLPGLVSELTVDKEVALVTGTNGKSTAATMLAAALVEHGQRVAFNAGGSNMLEGVAMALANEPRAHTLVAEVDEMVLGPLVRDTDPSLVILMNATREYTRGVSLEQTIAHWEHALRHLPPSSIVANADDPVIAHVATSMEKVTPGPGGPIWVAGGLGWRRDAELCRRCGERIRWSELNGGPWSCSGCGLSRPTPAWTLRDGLLEGPGVSEPFRSAVPGRWLSSNAAFAVAAAAALGVAPAAAIHAVLGVADVDGRYRDFDVAGRAVRLYLVKNPASWDETITLAADPDASIVFAMEAFGIRDLVPAWDVDPAPIAATRIVASGQRRLDVAAWLETGGIEVTLEPDPLQAIRSMPRGTVYVIANYTAFRDLRRRLT